MDSRLIDVREEILKIDLELYSEGVVPSDKQPLDAGFLEMPERLLAEYSSNRESSELGQILATAKRIQSQVDRVVVLGIGGSYMGARALMECCCQPYFNEFSRAERGGRPRMYFEGNNVDNDWCARPIAIVANRKGTLVDRRDQQERWNSRNRSRISSIPGRIESKRWRGTSYRNW